MFFPDAAKILNLTLLQPKPSSVIEGASIDTRTLRPGNLFVALQGTKEDGHRFLASAFDKGASGAIVSEDYLKSLPQIPENWVNLLPVKDTASAFLRLGGAFRQGLNLKAAIAVIGSVGKTSTKEFLHYIFSQKFQTLATQGNLNNHLGLPLTLFRLNPSYEYAICELGTNHLGEIRQLSEVLQPQAGILTKIAAEHLEGFGGMDQVYEGELELFHTMAPGSVAVIPDDDPVLDEKIKKLPLKFIRAGFSAKADYRLTQVQSEKGWVSFCLNGIPFSFPGTASFLSRNAAMGLALADQMGFPLKEIPSRWQDLKLPAGRFEVKDLRGIHIIFDGYNASPASFEAGLRSFEEIKADGRKMLVFSDMLELGREEKKYHEELGFRIGRAALDYVIAYGPRSKWSWEALKKEVPVQNCDYVQNAQEAAAKLADKLQAGDWLLMKASRGMKIEEVLTQLSGAESVHH